MQSTSPHDDDGRTNPEINSVTTAKDDIQIELGKDTVLVDTKQGTANNNNNNAAIDNAKQQRTIEEGNTIVTIEQSAEKKGDEQRMTVEEQQHELDDMGTVRIIEQPMENVPAPEQQVERGGGVTVEKEQQKLHSEMEAMKLIEQQQQADHIVVDQTAREEETRTMKEAAKEVDRIAVVEQQKEPTEAVKINDQQEKGERKAVEEQRTRDDEAIKIKQIEEIERKRVREEETMKVKQEEAERIEKAQIEAARAAEEDKIEQEEKIAQIALAREELIARLEKEEIVRKDTIAKLEEQVRKQEMESFKTETALRREEEVLAKLEKDESLRIAQIERLEAQVLKLEQAQDEAKLVLDRLRQVEQTREDEASKATDARKAIDAKIRSLRTPPQLQETLGRFTTSITVPSLPSFDDTSFQESMVQLKSKISVTGDFDLTNIPQEDVALVAGSGVVGVLIVAAIGSILDNKDQSNREIDVELIRDETRRSSNTSRQYDFNDGSDESSMPYGMMEQQQRSRNLTPPPVSSSDDNKNRGSFGTREQGRYPPPTPSDIQEQDAFARNEKGRSFGTGSGFTQSSVVGPLGLDDNGIRGGGGGLSSVSDTLSGKFEPSSSYGTPPPFRSPSSTSLPIMKGSSSTTSGYTTTVPPQQRKGNNNASGGMSKSFGKSSYNKKG